MIQLTRLNGMPITLNSDLIKTVEESPDTMITLINGEKLIVRESSAEIADQVLQYRSRLLAAVAPHLATNPAIARAASLTSLDLSEPPARPPRHSKDRGEHK